MKAASIAIYLYTSENLLAKQNYISFKLIKLHK
jgi:hypothetical protein